MFQNSYDRNKYDFFITLGQHKITLNFEQDLFLVFFFIEVARFLLFYSALFHWLIACAKKLIGRIMYLSVGLFNALYIV